MFIKINFEMIIVKKIFWDGSINVILVSKFLILSKFLVVSKFLLLSWAGWVGWVGWAGWAGLGWAGWELVN